MIDDDEPSENGAGSSTQEGGVLVPIESSNEESESEDEVWEISRKEFEDEVVDTWHSSPEL